MSGHTRHGGERRRAASGIISPWLGSGGASAVESESVEALVGRDVLEPTVATTWTQDEAHRRKAAPLRMYLGAAPGVGKTYAMLSEGHRRLERGTDVVVGFVATYGRKQTIAMLEGLEVVPMGILEYRGRRFEEMDVEALIERKPQVALVDELSHTNKLLTHRWLLERVWGAGYREDVDVLRVFVSQLRKKVEPDATRPTVIVTDPGIGYRWVQEPAAGEDPPAAA